MSDVFTASVPVPYRILGRPLRPLSIGALFLLHRLESAFILGGLPTLEDLAGSIFVCATTYREAVEAFQREDFTAGLVAWQKQLGAFDFPEKCKLFADYLREGYEIPSYDFNPGDHGELDVPSIQVIKCYLMMHTTLTETEILDRPFNLSIWDYLTIKNIKNEVRLHSGKQVDAIQAAQDLANELQKKFREQERNLA